MFRRPCVKFVICAAGNNHRLRLLALACIKFEYHAQRHGVKLTGRILEPRLELLLGVVVCLAVLLGRDKEVYTVVEYVDEPSCLVLRAELDLFFLVDQT